MYFKPVRTGAAALNSNSALPRMIRPCSSMPIAARIAALFSVMPLIVASAGHAVVHITSQGRNGKQPIYQTAQNAWHCFAFPCQKYIINAGNQCKISDAVFNYPILNVRFAKRYCNTESSKARCASRTERSTRVARSSIASVIASAERESLRSSMSISDGIKFDLTVRLFYFLFVQPEHCR
jgi:hypothetical protein